MTVEKFESQRRCRYSWLATFVLTKNALSLCVSLTMAHGQGLAAPIVAGPTVFPSRAIQDVVLFGNTPINPGQDPIAIPGLFGDAQFGFNREEQVGSTIQFNSVIGGDYTGSLPGFGDYVFGVAGGLTVNDFSGEITNVMQDANDPGFATGDPSSFTSGDFFVTGDQFAVEFLTGPLTGVVLFTDPTQDFSFVSSFDGLPPSVGTTLVNGGEDVINIILPDGTLVGTSSNRRIVVTPEPSTALLGLLAFICLFATRTRR